MFMYSFAVNKNWFFFKFILLTTNDLSRWTDVIFFEIPHPSSNFCGMGQLKDSVSCYGLIPLTLGFIGSDGGLSTLWHNCGFACQQRVLKMFSGPGYILSSPIFDCW